MKLRPTTTTRVAPLAFFDERAAIRERAQILHLRPSAPGIGRRTGSAPVAIRSAPNARREPSSSCTCRAPTSIDDTRDPRQQLDPPFA